MRLAKTTARKLTRRRRVGFSLDDSSITRSEDMSSWPSRANVRSSLGVISTLARPDAMKETSDTVVGAEATAELSSEDSDWDRALVGVR